MAFFVPSSSNSTDPGAEELLVKIDDSTQRKSRGFNSLQRTLSTPSPGIASRSYRSSTCPSRAVNYRGSRSLRSNSTPSRRTSSRSLRSVTSPSRISLLAKRQRKYSSLIQNATTFDFKFRNKHSRANHRSLRLPQSVDRLDVSSNHVSSNLSLTSQPSCHRVGRSISSPENLHPQLMQSANRSDFSSYSPSSPARLSHASQSHNILNTRSTHYSTNSFLQSPSISFAGDMSTDRSVPNLCSFTPGVSSSLDSSIYSSGHSIRGGLDNEEYVTTPGVDGFSIPARPFNLSSHTAQAGPSMWHTELSANLSQLALAHIASRDLSAIHVQSPPPSYDKLCDPESLPTYQEALEGERKGLKKFRDHRRVFTLPSVPDFNSSHTDPLLEESDQNYNVGFVSTSGGDPSDSEGEYTTILDAIPSHPFREQAPTVPIRFINRWSLRRLKCRYLNTPCLTSLCNKALVKKEINRRWPFIVSVMEDERCPGLLLVECSSNLTVAQLSDSIPRSADGLMSRQFFPSSTDTLDASSANITSSSPRDDATQHPLPQSLAEDDVEDAASSLNNHVMFYLCGKCVVFDSFDAENVRTHIDFDCTGHDNKWADISELYLVIRAFCFILVIICLLMWLPIKGW